MTYQTILVHMDRTVTCPARLAVGIGLARDFAAQLVGLYVDDTPEIAPSLAALLPSEVVEQYMRNALEAERTEANGFRQAAATAGVTNIEWVSPAGQPIDAAVAHTRCADLTVIGQPDMTHAGSSFAAQLVGAVLLEGGRPVLVVPYIGAQKTLGTNVLVAWDGGREASRALADALPILARARQVTVACLDPTASARGADALARDRVLGYLSRHGVSAHVESDNLGEADIAVGDWLVSRVSDLGIDLIVMGAYGHPRWRERVLGGATRTVLVEMTVPVLMAH